MADLVVALPEPHPEDDEDVVWGLSTASALWARGERGDALVWLHRAVEAATAAGQTFRASELGLCVTAIEEVLAAAMPATRHDVSDTATGGDALIQDPPSQPPSASPVSAQPRRRHPPRAPILDPWAEESGATPLRAPEGVATQGGDAYLVARRSTGSREEEKEKEKEEDVVTSAAPVDTTLSKKSAPAAKGPPPPAPRARGKPAGHEPPGHIAASAAAMPSKRPAAGAEGGVRGTGSRSPPAPAKIAATEAPPPGDPAQGTAPPLASASGAPPGEPAAPEAPATETEAPENALPFAPRLDGAHLAEIDAFADLPQGMHEELARAAQIHALATDEEVAGFGAALLLEGEAAVCTTIVDTPVHHALRKTLVTSQGTLAEGIPLRVVARAKGARVAVWDLATIGALRTCPWVVDELRGVADRLQACAGATLGPLGNLEEAVLGSVLERLRLRLLKPDEAIVVAGHPMPGLVVVGGGAVELIEGEGGAEGPGLVVGTARPGDMLFAGALLRGEPAPATARATSGGALLLVGETPVLRELLAEAPALTALLSGQT